jgi:hypothetical protein
MAVHDDHLLINSFFTHCCTIVGRMLAIPETPNVGMM